VSVDDAERGLCGPRLAAAVSNNIGGGLNVHRFALRTHTKVFLMKKSQVCLGLTCLSLGVFACKGEPERLEISSTQAALTASQNAELALQGVIDAGEFLASSTSIAKALNALGGQGETCESSGTFCPDGTDCLPPETVCTSDEIRDEDLEEARQELRDGADRLVRELRERILVEANLEASTSTSATYRLGPDVLCSGDTGDDAPTGAGVPAQQADLDEDCVDQVTRLEPRLLLTSPRDGDIDVALLLGTDRHAPLSLELYHDSLGVRLDLDEAFAVATQLGEDLEGLRELSGLLELRLVKNADLDYSLELNVLEALSAVVDSDGETLTTSLGASSPAWNVRVDGRADTLSAGLDLATFRLMGPLRLFADLFESDDSAEGELPPIGEASFSAPLPEEPSYTGVVELLLSGLSGSVHYTADQDVLAFENVGFGDATSTLKHDGHVLFGLDLNAAAGRRVNLRVSPTDEGAQISITPSFDLRVAVAFEYIADQFDGIADYLLHDAFHVWFEGESPAIEVGDEHFRVTSGTLHADSEAEPSANVSVSAGMCLVEAEAAVDASETSGAHPLASLQAAACE
jgi:hypothetical protein